MAVGFPFGLGADTEEEADDDDGSVVEVEVPLVPNVILTPL